MKNECKVIAEKGKCYNCNYFDNCPEYCDCGSISPRSNGVCAECDELRITNYHGFTGLAIIDILTSCGIPATYDCVKGVFKSEAGYPCPTQKEIDEAVEYHWALSAPPCETCLADKSECRYCS